MTPTRRWCTLTVVAADGSVIGAWELAGISEPDLAAIEAVARTALWATRRGGRLVVRDVVPEMASLLELVALPVEVEGQAEGREQSFRLERVQEEGHLGDPTL